MFDDSERTEAVFDDNSRRTGFQNFSGLQILRDPRYGFDLPHDAFCGAVSAGRAGIGWAERPDQVADVFGRHSPVDAPVIGGALAPGIAACRILCLRVERAVSEPWHEAVELPGGEFLQSGIERAVVVVIIDRDGFLIDDGAGIGAGIHSEKRGCGFAETEDKRPDDGVTSAIRGQGSRVVADHPAGRNRQNIRSEEPVLANSEYGSGFVCTDPRCQRRGVDIVGFEARNGESIGVASQGHEIAAMG